MTAALTDDEIEDRFFVVGSRAIIAMLGQFVYKGIPVTVQFNSGNDFILTTLLEARPGSLIFDLGGDSQANKRLLKAASCTFLTSINGIRVQFTTSGGVKQVSWDDAAAFLVKLPTRVIRLQRREAYRIVAPVVKFVSVRLQFSHVGASSDPLCPIHNIAVTGIGVTLPGQANREPGQTIERVTFTLPERGVIDCGGVVCHVTALAGTPVNQSCRIGVAFIDLPRPMEIAIQRYIMTLEQIRHSMEVDSS